MSQNISHAVMAQRHEAHDSLDFFPTPPWATRALCEYLFPVGGMVVIEPACGDGAMCRPLREQEPLALFPSDVHDYGWGHTLHDFLMPSLPPGTIGCDWVITNPPFRLAEQFIARGLEISDKGVAVLVRSVFTESVGRYKALFSKRPPAVVAQFAERVVMVKGRLVDPNRLYPVIDAKTGKPKLDAKTGRVKMRKPSTATSYAWIVWTRKAVDDTRFTWIPPCRKKLERPGDYPA